jgi:hypothetical protein
MTDETINYPQLIDNAMRGVVRDVLRHVAAKGLSGDHHFYISFSTTFPGVKISETLKSKYPKDITIVLQHQFWDFKIEEHQFHVTLSFSGMPEKLLIPFAALTAFADPSVKFGLQFQHNDMFDAEIVETNSNRLPEVTSEPKTAAVAGAAEIISIDSFRKK